ncbi:prepilin-type N-terminal cleavage/methylation domain-containing protein [Thermodesulfobacteriota bacterium]
MFIRKLKMKSLKNEGGFTLVECMVALGILSFGVLAVASMQTSSLLGTSKSNSVTQTTTVAMDRMERLMSHSFETWDPAAQNGDDSSSLLSGLPTLPANIESVSWSVTVGPSPLQDTARIIRVTVQSKDMGKPIILTCIKTKV